MSSLDSKEEAICNESADVIAQIFSVTSNLDLLIEKDSRYHTIARKLPVALPIHEIDKAFQDTSITETERLRIIVNIATTYLEKHEGKSSALVIQILRAIRDYHKNPTELDRQINQSFEIEKSALAEAEARGIRTRNFFLPSTNPKDKDVDADQSMSHSNRPKT